MRYFFTEIQRVKYATRRLKIGSARKDLHYDVLQTVDHFEFKDTIE